MLMVSDDKQYWIDRGWSTFACEKRLADCRRYAREYRNFPDHSRYSYRLINASQYRQTKQILAILQS